MEHFVEVRQIATALVRRWWLLALCALLGALLGYGFSLLQTPVYAATTTIHVGRSIKSSNLERVDLQLASELAPTYADLVRRRPILQGAIDTLQLDADWRELRDRVQVKAVQNTQLLEIRVSAASPAEAQLTADEVARQLILNGPIATQSAKSQETLAFVQRRMAQLQTNIEAGQAKLDALEASMAATINTATAQLPALQLQVQTLETLLAGWDSTYAQLLASLNVESSANQLAVVEPAEANPTPTQPRVKLNVLLALVMGLMLAVALIVVLEFLDDSLKPQEDIGQLLGLVTLGGLSPVKGKNLQKHLIARQDLFSPASEEYRLLRNQVQLLFADWPRKVIMFTSPTPSRLRSVAVANLGVVLAQAGQRVIIVDANLRQPVQHALFHMSTQSGLTDLLYEPGLELGNLLKATEVRNLRVLTVGALPPPHPTELLGSPQMGDLLARLAVQVDIVLCDCAHAVTIADALVLSSQVDGVILVVEPGKTRRAAAEQAVYNLQQAGANLLGAVVSPVPVAQKVASAKPKRSALAPVNGKQSAHQEPTVEPIVNQLAQVGLHKP